MKSRRGRKGTKATEVSLVLSSKRASVVCVSASFRDMCGKKNTYFSLDEFRRWIDRLSDGDDGTFWEVKAWKITKFIILF